MGLPLPFHNIKSRGNHAFLKILFFFLKTLTLPVPFFPVTSPVSKTLRILHMLCARSTPFVGISLQLDLSVIFDRYQLVFELEDVNSH